MSMFEKLAAPFPPSAVSWRAQTMKGDGTAALALAYIDARDVMHRLDDVCGPAGWQDTYAETPKGRLICTISIKCGDEWISKSDGAGDTDVEGEKGAISDSFKRAAVKWGIGRYLYEVDTPWAECESMDRNGKKVFKKWTPRGLGQLSAALNKVVPHVAPKDEEAKSQTPPDAPVTDEQRDWLATQAEKRGIPVQEVCKHFNVQSLKDFRFKDLTPVLDWMKAQQKAA